MDYSYTHVEEVKEREREGGQVSSAVIGLESEKTNQQKLIRTGLSRGAKLYTRRRKEKRVKLNGKSRNSKAAH